MALSQDSYLRFGPYLDLITGIHTALKVNEGIIKVVAPENCGKTSLCRQLVADLEAGNREVIFFESPPESVEYLHKRIQSELDLPRDKNFTRSLTHYLLAKQPPDNKLVLIYDDAEKISKEVFILIRLLNNIHDASETLVSQIICGTEKLDRVFDDPDLRSLTQYLNQSFTLGPMSRDDLEDFCSGYAKLAGITGRELTNRQMTDLFMVSKGQPGKTMELLARHFSNDGGIARGQDAGPETPHAAGSPAPVPESATPAAQAAENLYALEVEEILENDEQEDSFAPVYFKAVLSLVVVVAAIVLAVVLSGDNETVDDTLAQILADDSPLYLDEVEPEPAAPGNPAGNVTDAAGDSPNPDETAPPGGSELTAMEDGESTVAVTAAKTETVTAESEAGTQEVALNVPAVESDPHVPAADAEEDAESGATAPAVETLPVPSTATVLANAVQSWLEAWANGAYPAYLGAYHDDFEPAYHDSREAWETEREARVAGVTGIDVSYDRFELVESADGNATVRFWLYYQRGSYADETLKELVFRRADGDWLILSERNLELIVR